MTKLRKDRWNTYTEYGFSQSYGDNRKAIQKNMKSVLREIQQLQKIQKIKNTLANGVSQEVVAELLNLVSDAKDRMAELEDTITGLVTDAE